MRIADEIMPVGSWHIVHRRDMEILAEFDALNGITDVGKNDLLNTMFNALEATDAWWGSLIDGAGYTGVANSDTIDSHAGWDEYLNYSSNRKSWGQGDSVAKSVSNASPMVFLFTTAPGTVNGIFMIDDGTKGGNIGRIWSTALFPAALAVQSGDTLNATYVVSC